MQKFLIVIAVAALIFGTGTKAQASVLTFEDVTLEGFQDILNGYGGFIWQHPNTSTGAMSKIGYPNYPGMLNTLTSGDYGAINNFGDNSIIISLGTGYFDFNSASFGSLKLDNNNISLLGYKDEVEVGSDAFDVTNQEPYLYNAGSKFIGINKLVISSNGGSGDDWFVMDDFRYNGGDEPVQAPVPEPTSMLLGFMGFAGAAFAKRKKLG